MRVNRSHAAAAAVSLLFAACAQSPRAASEDSMTSRGTSTSGTTAPTDSAGWRSLFDGRTLTGWRAYRGTAPKGWSAADGMLVRESGGGDIVTDDVFRDFELELEWKVREGGNSGIMYRVTEDAENGYESGPEMQVLDDAKHADGKSRLTAAGALYGLYPAPTGAVKPAGEWNQVRIVVRGNHVEHWLNGVKTAEAEMNSPEWNEKVAASKFNEWPGYARAREGRILLQDHGDWVAYRNIRIRPLS